MKEQIKDANQLIKWYAIVCDDALSRVKQEYDDDVNMGCQNMNECNIEGCECDYHRGKIRNYEICLEDIGKYNKKYFKGEENG